MGCDSEYSPTGGQNSNEQETKKDLSELPQWMQILIPQLSQEFDKLCVKVHEVQDDQEKWLTEDTIEQALHDLAFLANNARYTYMRVRLLQERIKQEDPRVMSEDFKKDGN